MKIKIVLMANFFCASFLFAQEKKDSTDVHSSIYIAAGVLSQNKWNINQKLLNANMPQLSAAMPELVIGLNVFGKKYSGDLELTNAYFTGENEPNNTEFISGNYRANFSVNLINKQKIAFTTGLNVAYAFTELTLFNTNAVIDLNNLNLMANSAQVILKNRMLFVGPSASLYLFRLTNWKLRAKVAYEFALTRGRWRSEFLKVSNTVGEQGNNRFMFTLTTL